MHSSKFQIALARPATLLQELFGVGFHLTDSFRYLLNHMNCIDSYVFQFLCPSLSIYKTFYSEFVVLSSLTSHWLNEDEDSHKIERSLTRIHKVRSYA
jgi:hypothetical protein